MRWNCSSHTFEDWAVTAIILALLSLALATGPSSSHHTQRTF